MKGIGRSAMRIGAMLSLVLAAWTAVMWSRSYAHREVVALLRADGRAEGVHLRIAGVGCSDGVVYFIVNTGAISRESWDAFRQSKGPMLPGVGDGWLLTFEPVEKGMIPQVRRYARETFTVAGVGRYRYGSGAEAAGSASLTYWLIPHACFVALFSLLPALCLTLAGRRVLRRWSRRRQGQYLVCGYDLRATPGRCPECGRESPQVRGEGLRR